MSRKKRLLLHICCAPDATLPYILLSKEFEVVGYFYASNIHPRVEYERRVEALFYLSQRWGIPLVIERYAPEEWLKRVSLLKGEPEGGRRCRICYFLQLDSAAACAAQYNIENLTTTLTISPHKDPYLINSIGRIVALKHHLSYLPYLFRKKDGFKRSVWLSQWLGLYRQNYCGCIFSRI